MKPKTKTEEQYIFVAKFADGSKATLNPVELKTLLEKDRRIYTIYNGKNEPVLMKSFRG